MFDFFALAQRGGHVNQRQHGEHDVMTDSGDGRLEDCFSYKQKKTRRKIEQKKNVGSNVPTATNEEAQWK